MAAKDFIRVRVGVEMVKEERESTSLASPAHSHTHYQQMIVLFNCHIFI